MIHSCENVKRNISFFPRKRKCEHPDKTHNGKIFHSVKELFVVFYIILWKTMIMDEEYVASSHIKETREAEIEEEFAQSFYSYASYISGQKEEVPSPAMRDYEQRKDIIPWEQDAKYPWGWFSSSMPDEKFDQRLETEGKLILDGSNPLWGTKQLFTVMCPSDSEGWYNAGTYGEKEVIILAPQDYFSSEEGKSVNFFAHPRFSRGTFSLVAKENVVTQWGDKQKTVQRYYVIPKGYEDRYFAVQGREKRGRITELPSKNLPPHGNK